MTTLQISREEFKSIADLIYKHFGIFLSDQKIKLVEGRLQKLLMRHRFSRFQEYYEWLTQADGDITERMSELVDRMSTNHTFFWREHAHFEQLEKEFLPELEKHLSSSKKLRIWCAASSSGQEPYTLAMTLLNYFGDRYKMWDTGILATDISRNILDKAEEGIYTADDVGQLPPNYRSYFKKIETGDYQIVDKVKKEVTFRRFNLMNPFPFKGKMDIIFCRNVMIYFDNPTKKDLIMRMYNQLNTPGYLVTSLSESIDRTNFPFKYVKPGVYKKV